MTMNVIPEVQPTETPAAELNGAAPSPDLQAPATPGEAAKEARLNAELRARQERTKRKSDELFRQRKAFEDEKRAHVEQQSAAQKKIAEEMATLQAELRELKSGNPLIRAKGEEAANYLREFVAQGTPEAQVVNLQRELEKQRRDFEERFNSMSEASKKRDEEEQRRVNEVNRSQSENVIRQFTLWATTGEQASQFKHLNAEFTQDEVYNLARQVSDWAQKEGKRYNGREVAAYLEKHAEKVYKTREERRGMYLGAPSSATAAVSPNPKSASLPATGNGAPRTHKSQAKQMTREQEIEADLAALRKATQADTIARMPKKK